MAKRRSNPDAWRDAQQRILEALDLQAEYAALGVVIASSKPNRKGWLECHAVGGEPDDNPSAAINVAGAHPLLGRYKDSRGGSNCQPQTRTLQIWDFAVTFGPFADWKEARKHYADKAGVTLPSDAEGDRRPSERIEPTQWCEPLAALWLMSDRARGISMEALQAAGAILAKWPAGSANPHLCVAVPTWGSHLNEADPTGYVIWNQSGQPLQLWRPKSKRHEPRKMLALDNGWIVLGNFATADVVWKTEGPTDLLSLWSAALADSAAAESIAAGNLAAFTNACGAAEHVDSQLVAHLAGKAVYLVHDADTPGELGATEKWLPAIARVAREVRHVRLPYDPQPDHGKDVRDYLADDGHGWRDLQQLADSAGIFITTETAAAAGQPVAATPGRRPIEADDDPHRLARVNLARYADATGGIGTLRYWRNEWYTWKGKAYRKIDEKELRAKVSASIKAEFDRQNLERLESASTRDPGEVHKVTSHLVNNVLEATASMVLIPGHVEQMTWLEPPSNLNGQASRRERRNYLAVQNGILDIDREMASEDDCLLPHSPHWFSTVCLPYSYDDEATCPRWNKFLEHNLEMDPERIKVLQEWAGYLLLPDTGQQKFLVL